MKNDGMTHLGDSPLAETFLAGEERDDGEGEVPGDGRGEGRAGARGEGVRCLDPAPAPDTVSSEVGRGRGDSAASPRVPGDLERVLAVAGLPGTDSVVRGPAADTPAGSRGEAGLEAGLEARRAWLVERRGGTCRDTETRAPSSSHRRHGHLDTGTREQRPAGSGSK